MRYLPISYNTKDKNLLVLGGGLLALSKIKKMLETEFKIYVIAESFVNEILNLQTQYPERLFLKEMQISNDFVFFAYDFLLIATTNFELNNALENRAIKTKILYERCDVVSSSSALLNEFVSREDIVVGISNEKLNPAIAEIIKDDIIELLSTYNMDKIKILNKIRAELVRKNAPDVDETIKKLFDEEKIKAEDFLNNLQHQDALEETHIEAPIEFSEEKSGDITDSLEQISNESIDSTESKQYESVEQPEISEKEKPIVEELESEVINEPKLETTQDFEVQFERKHTSSSPYDTNRVEKSVDELNSSENFSKEETKNTETFQTKLKTGWNKFSKFDFFRKK